MPRIYDTSTYRKHKRPKGWGSLCPHDIDQESAQALLDSGVDVKGAVYNVDGRLAYRALSHEPDRWHGHPIPWSRLPAAARRGLIDAGRLTEATWRKAVRKGLGREFQA